MSRGSYVANGNIIPGNIVKFDATAGNSGKVLQAGATDKPMGIACMQQNKAPLTGLQSGYAAVAGETFHVFDAADPSEEPAVIVDAAYAQGTLIKPSTNGIGTQVTTDADYYVCRLLQNSNGAGDLVKCVIMIGQQAS